MELDKEHFATSAFCSVFTKRKAAGEQRIICEMYSENVSH